MFSHKDLLSGRCSHREYYAQFAHLFMAAVRLRWSKTELTKEYKKDKDFNKIPLAEWDHLAHQYAEGIRTINLKVNGDAIWCLSDGVCAAKEAALQIIEGNKKCRKK
jgi:hypothetical protein